MTKIAKFEYKEDLTLFKFKMSGSYYYSKTVDPRYGESWWVRISEVEYNKGYRTYKQIEETKKFYKEHGLDKLTDADWGKCVNIIDALKIAAQK